MTNILVFIRTEEPIAFDGLYCLIQFFVVVISYWFGFAYWSFLLSRSSPASSFSSDFFPFLSLSLRHIKLFCFLRHFVWLVTRLVWLAFFYGWMVQCWALRWCLFVSLNSQGERAARRLTLECQQVIWADPRKTKAMRLCVRPCAFQRAMANCGNFFELPKVPKAPWFGLFPGSSMELAINLGFI